MKRRNIRQLVADRRGAIAVLAAIVATSVIGLAALAVETANWYVQKAELQRIADSAAMAGALEYVKDNGATGSPYATAAQDYAALNGVPAGNAAVSLVPSPSNDGNLAVKVTATKTVPLMLSRVLSSKTSVTVGANAWSEIKILAPPCVEALNLTGTPDIKVTGNVSLIGCSLWSKSSAGGTTNKSASVALSGNSTLTANIYTPGTIYTNGNSAFSGQRFVMRQSAITDFIGANSAVTTALNNIPTVQSLGAPTTPNVASDSQTWTGAAGNCSKTVTGPASYKYIAISDGGVCSPYVVNLSGNFTIGGGGTGGAAVTVTGNVIVNFGPGTDTFNGLIDLTGQTGGCFGLGTNSSTTGCTASTTAGTYSVAAGSGQNSSTSIATGSGYLTVGRGTFGSAADLVLTGSGNVNWNTAGTGNSTTNVAGNVTFGTASYTFGAGVYQIKSDFSFPNSSGSLTINGSDTASSLITIGGTMTLGHNGASDTYSYSTTSTTFILANAPVVHGAGTGTHLIASPCPQTSSSHCAANLTGSGIAGLLLAVPQAYTGTVNVPSENNGTITVAGMIYGAAGALNIQGNASSNIAGSNECFGFVVGTAALAGTASFSTCSPLQGVALGLGLAE